MSASRIAKVTLTVVEKLVHPEVRFLEVVERTATEFGVTTQLRNGAYTLYDAIINDDGSVGIIERFYDPTD